MTDQRRLFLHAGTHKTGTTSLQKLLFDRRRDIAARGVQVVLDHPSAGREMPANCRSIANAFVRQEVRISICGFPKAAPRILHPTTCRHATEEGSPRASTPGRPIPEP
jgi:hypothetical protein